MMIRLPLILAALLCASAGIHAQSSQAFREMVASERAFASLSRTSSTRNAFLNYLTDSTVLFMKGKPVKGKQSWAERPVDTTLLFWEPMFGGTSADGMMGFSTGPWQWSKGRNTQPEPFGFFASVWTKRSGSWKLAADIGISFPENYQAKKLTRLETPASTTKQARQNIREADSVFSDALAANATQVTTLLSPDALLLRDGLQPFTRNELHKLNATARQLKSRQFGCETTAGNDFAFCYGSVEISPEGDQADTTHAGYLRVFSINDRGFWEVVLDVQSR